jgi:ferritin-like metal-binding protein YciE
MRPILHCAAAMGIEHYEINAYEAAIRLSDALGAEDVGGLLRANLRQEVDALEALGRQAERLAGAAV